MMYSNKLVACIKVNGKVLREDKEFVSLPFGTEYSILIKNLNSVRVQVKIDIDGTDATGWLIVNPNSDITVERFVKDLNQGNRFKFIERTQAVEDHRGIQADDGLIRIEYAFEKIRPVVQNVETHHYHYNHSYPTWWYNYNCTGQNVYRSRSLGAVQQSNTGHFTSNLVKCSAMSYNSNDVGITVPGSISNQKFVTVSGFDVEQSSVIVLRLRGYVQEKKVETPVTVDVKKICVSCGKKSEYKDTFCSSCGTCLNVI